MSPTLDILALEVLAGTNEPVGLSEVARRARRGSVSGHAQALDRLTVSGLVLRRPGGYLLNREHVVAPLAERLVGLRGEVFSRMRALAATWTPEPLLLAVYGSFARADGDADSDIDLLLVFPEGDDSERATWRERTVDLSERVQAWTGNVISINATPLGELHRMARAGEPLVASLRTDAVLIFGDLTVLTATGRHHEEPRP